MKYTITHPEIQTAFSDMKRLLSGLGSLVEKVELFGSTLKIPIAEARDVDFFVGYRGITFEDVHKAIIETLLPRNVVVESIDASYTNCPKWTTERPLTLHIILYQEGKSEFSEKLLRTRQDAVDVTSMIFDED